MTTSTRPLAPPRSRLLLLRVLALSGWAVGCGGSAGQDLAASLKVTPAQVSLAPLATQPFTATAAGVNGVTWSVQEGSTGGSITGAGVYTAPGGTGTFHVIATSLDDASMRAQATVTVAVPSSVSVSVAPAAVTLAASSTQQFTATVTGSSNTAVAWTLREGASCGTLSAAGLYTAPAASATCHVDATAAADPGKVGSALVTVGGGAGTNVPAGAIATQTWTAAGSPYRVYGDVYIPSGNRLTIQPGVQVRFQGHYRLEGPGVIDARGTSPSQRDILFTAEDTATGWYGIRIWNGAANGQPPDVSDYHLENCIVEYVIKDGSRPRSFGNADYNDTRGAVYVLGQSSWNASCPEQYCGLKQSDLHFSGLTLRHNRAMDHSAVTSGAGAGMYFNTLTGGVHPVWTDVVFDDNQSYAYGAAFQQHHAGPLTFKNCTFTNGVAYYPDTNDGSGYSGSIGYWDVSGPVTLDGCHLAGNTPAAFATIGSPDVVVLNAVP